MLTTACMTRMLTTKCDRGLTIPVSLWSSAWSFRHSTLMCRYTTATQLSDCWSFQTAEELTLSSLQ